MLRKLFIALFATFAFSQIASAQVKWTAMGGINVPNFSTNMDYADVKDKVGWQAGFSARIGLGIVAIQPELMYVRQGLTASSDNLTEFKSSSIDIPILASFEILDFIRLNVGPLFSVYNEGKMSQNGGAWEDVGRTRPSMSYTAGAAVVLFKKMVVDLRYNGQFKSVENPAYDFRTHNVALSVGYVF